VRRKKKLVYEGKRVGEKKDKNFWTKKTKGGAPKYGGHTLGKPNSIGRCSPGTSAQQKGEKTGSRSGEKQRAQERNGRVKGRGGGPLSFPLSAWHDSTEKS